MNDDIRQALAMRQIERNMPRLKALMEYSDQHSTKEQHDQIVTILSECILEILGILPDQNRRVDFIHNIHAQRRASLNRGDVVAASWYRAYERDVLVYFESFQSLRMIPEPINDTSIDIPIDDGEDHSEGNEPDSFGHTSPNQ